MQINFDVSGVNSVPIEPEEVVAEAAPSNGLNGIMSAYLSSQDPSCQAECQGTTCLSDC